MNNIRPILSIPKSPSDTTLYTPALRRNRRSLDAISKISNFVESMRLEEDDRGARTRVQDHVRPRKSEPGRNQHSSPRDRHDRDSRDRDRQSLRPARELADQVIVEAERFKADLVPPRGRSNDFVDNDDEFFHITCHVDWPIRERIEHGDYVELDKLLPHESKRNEDKPLKIFERDGETYIGPASKSGNKISSLRKWDQAFRIYAAIYSQANPGRAAEIWQYVHIIHTAAGSFVWENVSWYDETFRQLMAHCPSRSWAKTYVQAWHLAMVEPLGAAKVQTGGAGKPAAGQHDWREDCCWCFNRNQCKKSGNECLYEHRCSYCGGWNHGSFNCRKRNKKGRKSSSNGFNGNSRSSPKRSGDKHSK